jgi:adenine-specific DNA methylase
MILEPSFGDGEFIKAAISTKIGLGATTTEIHDTIFGTELDPVEYGKVRNFLIEAFTTHFQELRNEDFFDWAQKKQPQFDAVLGNPPFIRYQNFPEPSRTNAMALSKKQGVVLNRLTNIWVPFLVLSVALLKKNGRLGMVIPAELLQVSYAGPLRKYLIDSFKNITIVTCNELLFENAEQEVVVVLADGKNVDSSFCGNIEVVTTETKSSLIDSIENYKMSKQNRTVLHSTEKWTKHFLNQDEIDFMRAMRSEKRVVSFSDYFEVDVGVVTGKNDFFIVNKQTSSEYDLAEFVRPAIGRSYQLKNEVLSVDDWEAHWKDGEDVGLLDFASLNGKIPKHVSRYLASGISRGVNLGYKCAIRKEWYKVPSLWVPDAFMFRQIHDFPHLVLNHAAAIPTDTIHRVRRVADRHFPQVLFYTYLTAASAEIEGRSYGGGVLELEPTEAERLLVPNPEFVDPDILNYFVSRKENGKFLKKNSDFILRETLGFSTSDLSILESIYQKLFSRRKTRKKVNRVAEAPYIDQDRSLQLF